MSKCAKGDDVIQIPTFESLVWFYQVSVTGYESSSDLRKGWGWLNVRMLVFKAVLEW